MGMVAPPRKVHSGAVGSDREHAHSVAFRGQCGNLECRASTWRPFAFRKINRLLSPCCPEYEDPEPPNAFEQARLIRELLKWKSREGLDVQVTLAGPHA
jgi:hypothetical protein